MTGINLTTTHPLLLRKLYENPQRTAESLRLLPMSNPALDPEINITPFQTSVGVLPDQTQHLPYKTVAVVIPQTSIFRHDPIAQQIDTETDRANVQFAGILLE